MPLFQLIGRPDANWLFDANPDPSRYEPYQAPKPPKPTPPPAAAEPESKDA